MTRQRVGRALLCSIFINICIIAIGLAQPVAEHVVLHQKYGVKTNELTNEPVLFSSLLSRSLPLDFLQLSIRGDYRTGDQLQLSEGSKGWNGAFDVNAYKYITNRIRVHGTAGYMRGERKDVTFTTTDDAEYLYPYLMITNGNISYKHERYNFAGELFYDLRPFVLSFSAAYEAKHSYATLNPRPHNVTGVLDVAIDALYENRHIGMFALRIGANKYDQKNDTKIFGNNDIYNLMHHFGHGVIYKPFTNDFKSPVYKGLGWNTSVRYEWNKPSSDIIASGVIHYQRNSTERVLNERGTIFSASKLNAISYKAIMGYRFNDTYIMQAEAFGRYDQLKGDEYLYGAPNSGVYPLISIEPNRSGYDREQRYGAAFKVLKNNANSYGMESYLSSHFVLKNKDERYESPSSLFNVAKKGWDLNGMILYTSKWGNLRGDLHFESIKAGNINVSIPGIDNGILSNFVTFVQGVRSADEKLVKLNVIAFPSNLYGLYFGIDYQYNRLNNSSLGQLHQHNTSFTIGINL